jgi:hypothetical protein
VFSKSILGARLCPQDQPQRSDSLKTFGLTDVQRLVLDTAALRPKFENTP